MRKRNTMTATAFFTGLLALAPVYAQNQGATTTETQTMDKMDKKGSGQLSSPDQKFVMDAAADGMMEVELGRIAAQKASSADVKSFGQRMVDDHTKANTQLKSIASQKGITLPTTLSADKRQEMDKMSKLSGAEFDKMYMSHMLKAHKKDITEFEKESTKAGDSSLRSFAQTTLPTLREHMTMAQSIATKVGASENHSMHGGSNH